MANNENESVESNIESIDEADKIIEKSESDIHEITIQRLSEHLIGIVRKTEAVRQRRTNSYTVQFPNGDKIVIELKLE